MQAGAIGRRFGDLLTVTLLAFSGRSELIMTVGLFGCPRVGIDEIPTTIERCTELKMVLLDRALRHKKWEDAIDPRRKAINKKECQIQMDRIMRWHAHHVARLLEHPKNE